MNFKEIESKYPKSHDALLDWIDKGWAFSEENGGDITWGEDYHYSFGSNLEFWRDGYYDGEYHYTVDLRRLFDFFDDHDLYVTVTTFRTEEKPFAFIFDIESRTEEGLAESAWEEDYQTRHAAESAAFLKAFEILETRLPDGVAAA